MQLEENELAIASSPKETSTLGEPTGEIVRSQRLINIAKSVMATTL